MAVASLTNSSSQKIDTIFTAGDSGRLKLAVGTVDVAGETDDASWQGVATHEDGATFTAGDGVVVGAGVKDDDSIARFSLDDLGNLRVATAPTTGNVSDAATLAITTGGTSQSLFSSNPDRKWLFIQNIDASEDLWFNIGASATADSPSIKLGPGDSAEFAAGFVPSQSIAVIAATTAHKFTAKEA